MNDLITSVSLRTAPSAEIRLQADRVAVLVEFSFDDDPVAPAVSYDVVTNVGYDTATEALHKVGALLHDVAHVLLSKQAAVLDLTATAGGAS